MTVTFAAAMTAALVVVTIARPRHRSRSLDPLVTPGAPGAAHTGRSANVRRRSLRRLALALPGRRRRHEAKLDQAMPDLLDLLVLTLQAGLPAPNAFATLAAHVPPAVRPAVERVNERCAQGERFVEALDALVDHLGTRALGLVAAIATAERSGLPLAPTVDRIADDARAHRRRSAEIEARRLPVRLAVPLVCCTLPSFVCIAIGPVLIGALSSLRAA